MKIGESRSMLKIALYARVSTSDQNLSRQIEETREFIHREYPDAEIVEYADIISGASEAGGDEYQRLRKDISDNKIDAVVVHELSRLSRLGAGEIHQFIQYCLANETGVHDMEVGLSISLDDDLVDRAVSQLIAGVMGDLARIEHKQKLRRIQSGIKSAQKNGKWTGRPPRGFSVENGYLRVEPGEFLAIRDGLERIERGDDYGTVAEDIGIPESTLRRLHKKRSDLYLYAETSDERVDEAVDGVRPLDDPNIQNDPGKEAIREIVREELAQSE